MIRWMTILILGMNWLTQGTTATTATTTTTVAATTTTTTTAIFDMVQTILEIGAIAAR